MINLAFIKYAGMASGGTEKYLQTLACNLPKDRFNIDYYYTDIGNRLHSTFNHPDTDPARLDYMLQNGISPIKIDIESIDCRPRQNFVWNNTNFKDIFRESDYDILQTGRFGYTEFPFCDLLDIPMVDSIHSCGQCIIHHQSNIAKTVLLSRYQADRWIQSGGDASKVIIIPPVIENPMEIKTYGLRKQLNISEDAVVCGMHQRVDDGIYSFTPIQAIRNIDREVIYLIMGGSDKYKKQAEGLDNVKFVDFSSDASDIYSFLNCLDFYLHGRYDGETCSASIIEALKLGLPVISHASQLNNGHAEQIQGCGFFCQDIRSYTDMIRVMIDEESLRKELSEAARNKYYNTYALDKTIAKYVNLYEGIA